MATKQVSGNAAKKKPRGKPFVSGDARSNQNGQRSAAAVRTAAEMRELYVKFLHQPIGELKPSPNATIMETIALRHLLSAVNGSADEREKLYDRIWGKSTEKVDASINGTMKYEHSGNLTIQAALELSADELARRQRDALGETSETKREW